MNDGRADSCNLAVSHASERWYAVCCKPRQEAVAEANLQRQGYRTYLPRICHKRRRKGQWVSKAEIPREHPDCEKRKKKTGNVAHERQIYLIDCQ